MEIHESNPRKTLIVLSVFILILIVGFFTMRTPLLTFKLDMVQSIGEIKNTDTFFYPWQLNGVLSKETNNVVIFDIRDKFVFGQGHIPGAENLSAQDLMKEESIERLEELREQNFTVVLYGEDQLQANGPWMLFRQVGFNNVKILLGGYQYYLQHKDNLLATKNDPGFQKEVAKFNFAEMAAPKDGAVASAPLVKKPVEVSRRKKSGGTSGGC